MAVIVLGAIRRPRWWLVGVWSAFPALDPEPPPRSWAYRCAVAACAVAVTAVVGVGVWQGLSLPGGRHAPTSEAGSHAGLVFWGPSGTFGAAGSNGSGARNLQSLGSYGQGITSGAVASLDGRYLVASNGAVVSIGGNGMALQPAHVRVGANDMLGGFAGADRYVVLINEGSGSPPSIPVVSLVDWSSGRTASLGEADSAAGDPQSAGVFVSLPAATHPATAGDSGVELRDLGGASHVLITAATVDRALGRAVGARMALSPFPDETGDKVAITVNPPGTPQYGTLSSSALGLVVIDRSGHLIAALRGGPIAGPSVYWSPDGRSLLFFSQQAAGAALSLWRPGSGQPPTTRALPDRYDTPRRCLWSPDGVSFLCQMADESSGTTNWVTGRAAGGPMQLNPGPGAPLVWVTSASTASTR